jgi:hypothetical protein
LRRDGKVRLIEALKEGAKTIDLSKLVDGHFCRWQMRSGSVGLPSKPVGLPSEPMQSS